jgi:hypothetical protein
MGKKKEHVNKINFLTSTIISGIAGVISSISYFGIEWLFPIFYKIPKLLWLIIFLILYIATCLIVEKKQLQAPKIRKLFRIPLWSELRAFGEQRFAKLSYYALIIIPLMAFCYDKKFFGFAFSNYFSFPENLKLSYVSSWAIAIALLVFSVSCPKDLRRIRVFDKVRTVNLVLNNVEKPRIIITQDEPADDPILDKSSLLLRAICFLFYSIGVVVLLIILIKSANLVLRVT